MVPQRYPTEATKNCHASTVSQPFSISWIGSSVRHDHTCDVAQGLLNKFGSEKRVSDIGQQQLARYWCCQLCVLTEPSILIRYLTERPALIS